MAATDLDVHYVAHLARLELTPEEERTYGAQLGHILDYINQLSNLNTDGVEPTAHPIPMENVTRPDAVEPSLNHDLALLNAPSHSNGLFMVPKIVE